MKQTKNILITTLSKTKDLLDLSYYHFKDEFNNAQYCTGISNAEAGTKYMLSNYKIDQIYILGPKNETYDGKTYEIKNVEIPVNVDVDSINELEFYCYRMSQFLNHIDIEADDLIFGCDKQRREELEEEALKVIPNSYAGPFFTLANDEKVLKKYNEYLNDKTNVKELKILKHILYLKMDLKFKLEPLVQNDNITVRYIGVDMMENGEISGGSLFNTVSSLFPKADAQYNIYMDLQGMDKGDSVAIWNILTIYQNVRNCISIKSIICTNDKPNSFTNAIYNEYERYNIELLLSGIRSFLYYGKTEQFEDYFRRSGFTNKQLKNLLIAMQYVNTGVSLNNISDLTYGIEMLRILVKQEPSSEMNIVERFVYGLMCVLIKDDYGRMLETGELELVDLLSWTIKKGFHQQALTMVEALVPKDLVKKGIYYYARSKEDIECFKKYMNVMYWSDMPKNRFNYQDVDHFFIKNYARDVLGFVPKVKQPNVFAKLKIRMLHETIENYGKAYSDLGNEDMLFELLVNYYRIGNLRNTISHAKYNITNLTSIDEIEENRSIEEVTKALNMFLGLYRSACKRMRDNKNNSIELEDDEIKCYFNCHRLYDLVPAIDNNIQEQNMECSYNGNTVNIRIQLHKTLDSYEDE